MKNMRLILVIVLELIDRLILYVTHLKYYNESKCNLIKYNNLLVIMESYNKIK